MNKTAIIIVNYKTPWHLDNCLKSVFKNTADFHIYLVQNSPDSNSLKIAKKYLNKYSDLITQVINDKNLGYVGGVNCVYNLAIQHERVCLLNSDMIATSGWLEELNKTFDENENAVQVAPDISQYYQESFPARIIKWQIMKRFPEFGGKLYLFFLKQNPPRSSKPDQGFIADNTFYNFCAGACNLFRTKYFKELGYFLDPNIVHGYGDDFDMSYYLRQFGEIGANNKSYFFHFQNVSFNKLPARENLKEKIKKLNRFYIVHKWSDRLKKDIDQLDEEELLELAEHQEVKVILEYFGLLITKKDFKNYIESVPALKYKDEFLGN